MSPQLIILILGGIIWIPTTLLAAPSLIDQIEEEQCIALATKTCSRANPHGVFDQAIVTKVLACQAEMKSEGLDCSKILPENAAKVRCHPSEFCRKSDPLDALKDCGLGFLAPFVAPVTGLWNAALFCLVGPGCSTEISPEMKREIEQQRGKHLHEMMKAEAVIEKNLCLANPPGYGCPLREISCREWEEASVGHTLIVDGHPFKISEVSQKDGFNKNNFCNVVRVRSANEEARKREAAFTRAAAALKIWFADYGSRFQCYQLRYRAEEWCKAAGTGVSLALAVGAMFKALALASASEAMLPAEIAQAMKSAGGLAAGDATLVRPLTSAARAPSLAREPAAEIPVKHRPTSVLVNSGRPVGVNEVKSAGRVPKSRAENEAFIKSPDFRDGTFVTLVVRDKLGNDHLLYENRVPDGPALADSQFVSHRSLIQRYRDLHNGEEPQVVASGECLVGMNGIMVGCINRSGSFPDGNGSTDYLVDVMQAHGFRRDGSTAVINYVKGQSEEVGHLTAELSVHREQQMLQQYPELTRTVRAYAQRLYQEHPGDNSNGVDLNWARSAMKFSRGKDPNLTGDEKKALENIWKLTMSMREGTSNATYGIVNLIKANSASPELEIQNMQRLLPQFLQMIPKLPPP